MTNHVLYIFDENSTRFSSLNHPKQFEEKITTIIIKTLAVTRNTKSLTREASHNHIHTFSRNVFRLHRMNIPTIQMRVRIIQTISLTRILIKFIGIHHSELVGLFKSQLNSPNTREESCNVVLLWSVRTYRICHVCSFTNYLILAFHLRALDFCFIF